MKIGEVTSGAVSEAIKYSWSAQIWAEAENSGHRFGHPKTLNADAILVAQTQAMGEDVTVITKNVRHLAPFVEAVWWTHFAP